GAEDAPGPRRELGRQRDREAGGGHGEERADQDPGQVVAELAAEAAPAPDAPDVVQRLLDVPEQAHGGPEHQQRADAGDHAAARVRQYRTGEPEDRPERL